MVFANLIRIITRTCMHAAFLFVFTPFYNLFVFCFLLFGIFFIFGICLPLACIIVAYVTYKAIRSKYIFKYQQRFSIYKAVLKYLGFNLRSTYNLQHQTFSLPNSMIHYIAKNPSSTNAYLKLAKSCKYFFRQKPLLIVSKLCYICGWIRGLNASNGFKNAFRNDLYTQNRDVLNKIWITEEIDIDSDKFSKIASSLASNVFRIDASKIKLSNQNISFNEFLTFASAVNYLKLVNVKFIGKKELHLHFEDIIKNAPNLKTFIFDCHAANVTISHNTVQNFLSLPHFSNITRFELFNTPESFGIVTMFDYLKTRENLSTYFNFRVPANDLIHHAKIEAIVDEILSTNTHSYIIPQIDSHNLNLFKIIDLRFLYYKQIGTLFLLSLYCKVSKFVK